MCMRGWIWGEMMGFVCMYERGGAKVLEFSCMWWMIGCSCVLHTEKKKEEEEETTTMLITPYVCMYGWMDGWISRRGKISS